MDKNTIRKIIEDIKKENIILSGKNPIALKSNKVIFEKYNKLYPNIFKNSEIFYIFKSIDIDNLLDKMFCYCGNKKQYTTRKDLPYAKYCSQNCCKKSKEYQANRYNSWKITWNNHTDEEKDEIHKRQQQNRKMTEESISKMKKHREETVSNWSDDFKKQVSQKLSKAATNTWNKRTKEERIKLGNKISHKLNSLCDNGLTIIQNAINKGHKTYEERTGYDNPFKNPEISSKIGLNNKLNAKQRLEKARNTMNKTYGCWYSSSQKHKDLWKDEKFKDMFLDKKVKTCLEKYGIDNFTKTKEYQIKSYNTKVNNNSFNTSKPEENCYKLLLVKFDKDDIIRQHRSTPYPFSCDFYIKSLDLYIECNFHWTHGKEPFDKNNLKHIKKIEEWKRKSNEINFKEQTKKFYKNALNIWIKYDPLKLQTFKKNNLNYKIFYNEKEFNEWFEKV